jgi:uncharacterized protein YwqG
MKLPPLKAPLHRVAPLLEEFSAPCVSFSLLPKTSGVVGRSKLGGTPDLPGRFEWPTNEGHPLDFLLQINLSDAATLDVTNALPESGLLSFFYDLENQPWGYDPGNLGGFRVVYTPPETVIENRGMSGSAYSVPECEIACRSGLSLPHMGSRAYSRLSQRIKFDVEEKGAYFELQNELSGISSPNVEGGCHRLLGHSANVQGDMQLEAQLVTSGLYCGNSSGYQDARRKQLEAGADDWVLLLQLDSDDTGVFMWGDSGMLYYWIRSEDIAERRFNRVWMTMQCG